MASPHSQPGLHAPLAAAADNAREPFLPSDPKELEIDHTDDLVFLRPYVSDQTYEFIRHNSGLVLVGASQFFFACMAATVKYFLSISDISVPTLIAVRMGITAVFSAVILLIQRDPYPFLGPPEHRKLLFVRGAVGFLGLSSNYLSLKGLSVSDSAAIGFLIPAATAVLGVLVLKEKMTRREVIAGGLCLCGVMLVARPPALFGSWAAGPDPGLEKPKSSRAVAVFWAFMSVVGASFAYITIRRLGDKVHALHSMLWFSYMCVVVSSMAILITPGPTAWVDNLGDFVLIMAIGVFGFMGQMLLTLGLQRERVGRAGIAVYLNVFFAIILELLIFHTLPSFLSLIGIGIILTSAYWVASASNKAAPREDLESQPISRSPSPLPANSHSIQGELYDYSATTPESEDGPREASIETIRQLDDGRLKPKRPSSKVRRRSSASTISVNGTRGQ